MWHSSTLWFRYSDIGYICTSLTDWLTVSYWWNLKGVSQWCHRKQFAMSLGDCKSKSWLAGRKGAGRLRVWSRWCSSRYGWVLRQKPTATGVSRVPSLHTLRRVHQEVRKHWANKYTWELTGAAEGSMGLAMLKHYWLLVWRNSQGKPNSSIHLVWKRVSAAAFTFQYSTVLLHWMCLMHKLMHLCLELLPRFCWVPFCLLLWVSTALEI